MQNFHDLFQLSGISRWGIVNNHLPRSFDHYQWWVAQGLNGPLEYMADEKRKVARSNLKVVYPEFQQAVVCLFDYSQSKKKLETERHKEDHNGLKIASYVFSFEDEDYHHAIGRRLEQLLEGLKKNQLGLEGMVAIDTRPILERDLAAQAGLGWIGKNSMLINREIGSYTLIGVLLLNQKIFVEDGLPLEVDHCGHCRKCIDACPTEAILEGQRVIDSSLCLSTFTIEQFKDVDPPPGHSQSSEEIFGCDICQDICPWNSKIELLTPILEESSSSIIKKFFFYRPIEEVVVNIKELSNRGYRKLFVKTSLARTGRVGMLKNLKRKILQ